MPDPRPPTARRRHDRSDQRCSATGDSHARNLFCRGRSVSASCSPRRRGRRRAVHRARAGQPRRPRARHGSVESSTRVAVARPHIAPGAMHFDVRHHPDHRVGIGGRGVEQRAVGFGQRGRRRDDEDHRRRRFAGRQLGRLDERVLGQPFAQCRDHATDPGQPRPGHQDHVAALHGRRTQPRPDRRHHCVDCVCCAFCGDCAAACLVGHAELPTFDHSRSEPLTMSAPQARCRPATGPRL